MKKTIINILCVFLQTCLIASEAELAEVEDETRVEYGKNVFELAKTNKASLPFLDYLLTHVFKAHKSNFRRGCYSKEDYYQNLHGIHCAGTDLIVNAAEPVQSPIPQITHTILIKEREADEPLLNEAQKRSFSKLIKALPVTSGWRHLLWVLDPGVILPQDLEGAAENTENIELMPIFSMNNSCINDLISAGKNDHAIAFLGYEILNTHGGITRTIDKPVNGNIALFCSTFSFLAELDNDSARVIDPSFLASTPQHPIINRALELARYHSDPDKARYCSYLQKLPNDPLAEHHVKYGNGPISIAFHQHAVAGRDMILCYGENFIRTFVPRKLSAFRLLEACVNSIERAEAAKCQTPWVDKWLSIPEADYFHRSQVQYYWGEMRLYGDFLANLFPGIAGKTLEEAHTQRAIWHEYTKRVIEAHRDGNLSMISDATPCDEFNRHYIWINDPVNPAEPKPDALKYLVKNLRKSGAKTWNYHFWTNIELTNTKFLLEDVSKKYGLNISIHDIDRDFYPQMKGKGVYNRLFKGRYFTNMSDILRFNLIYGFGKSNNAFNIYSDLHVEDNGDILPLTSYFDCMFMQEGGVAGTCFIGAKKGARIMGELLDCLDDLQNKIRPEWREFGKEIGTPRYTSLAIFTLFLNFFNDSRDRVLPAPAGTLISPHHTGGWLKGEHGQTSIRTNPISNDVFFGKDDFLRTRKPYAVLKDHGWHTAYIDIAQILYSDLPDGSTMTRDELIDHLAEKRNAMEALGREIYRTRLPKNTPCIPEITHRVWVTKEGASAVEPDPMMVTRYIDSLKILPKHFRNIFWCTDKSRLPQTIRRLEEVNVEIREIAEFFDEIQRDPRMLHEEDSAAAGRPIIIAKHLFDALSNDGRKTNANDILRRLIVLHHGGLYSDMGFRFERDISELLKLYDYMFVLYEWQCLDHSLFAARPQDPLLRKELELLHNVWKHPKKEEMKRIMPDANNQLMLTGSHSFMGFVDTNMPADARVLFLPAHEYPAIEAPTWRVETNAYISWVRGGTWYGQGNLRNNISIFDSKLDIFTAKPF